MRSVLRGAERPSGGLWGQGRGSSPPRWRGLRPRPFGQVMVHLGSGIPPAPGTPPRRADATGADNGDGRAATSDPRADRVADDLGNGRCPGVRPAGLTPGEDDIVEIRQRIRRGPLAQAHGGRPPWPAAVRNSAGLEELLLAGTRWRRFKLAAQLLGGLEEGDEVAALGGVAGEAQTCGAPATTAIRLGAMNGLEDQFCFVAGPGFTSRWPAFCSTPGPGRPGCRRCRC